MNALARQLRCLAALLAVVIANGGVLHSTESPDLDRLALMPLKRGVRDITAIAALDVALGFQLTEIANIASQDSTRQVLRRHRLRDVDTAPPALLREIAEELDVDWILSVTIHDIPRHDVPDLSLSMRLFDGKTGEIVWSEFQGRSGLDGRRLLGLGVVESIELLVPVVVQRLLEELPLGEGIPGTETRPRHAAGFERLGTVAIVPFTSYVDIDAQQVADTATEATRAVLDRSGTQLASPGCIRQGLRHQRAHAWGQLSNDARQHIRTICMADMILTGSVERWSAAGTGLAPEPLVSVALRLLDAESGKVLWMEGNEAAGWDGESLFGSGRVYSRGKLLDRMVTTLTNDMVRDDLFTDRGRQDKP